MDNRVREVVIRQGTKPPKPGAGAGNSGLPVVGQNQPPVCQWGIRRPRVGRGREREAREADANPHSTEGKPSLVEALCWPPPPSRVAPTLGLRACGLPAWVWWSEAMAGCLVQE